MRTRVTAAQSRWSICGQIVNDLEDRVLYFESELEMSLAYVLLTEKEVASVREQYPAVDYVDDLGRVRTHTFDLFVTLRSGVRIAMAVKPRRWVEKSGVSRTLELIAAQTGSEYADHFEVRTEEHVPRARAENAIQIYEARRVRDADDVAALTAIVARQRGKVLVSDLVAALPDRTGMLTAILNLIDDGVLLLDDEYRRVDLASLVLPSKTC